MDIFRLITKSQKSKIKNRQGKNKRKNRLDYYYNLGFWVVSFPPPVSCSQCLPWDFWLVNSHTEYSNYILYDDIRGCRVFNTRYWYTLNFWLLSGTLPSSLWFLVFVLVFLVTHQGVFPDVFLLACRGNFSNFPPFFS